VGVWCRGGLQIFSYDIRAWNFYNCKNFRHEIYTLESASRTAYRANLLNPTVHRERLGAGDLARVLRLKTLFFGSSVERIYESHKIY
jgi:hypothetical protein